jgi:hypothetical protein
VDDPRGEVLYTVYLAAQGAQLYRLADDAETAFLSNHDRGLNRLPGEDEAIYRGISCLSSEQLARKYVRRFGGSRKPGVPPRWSVILRIQLNPGAKHVLADTRSAGHYTVWGNDFRVIQVIPIENGNG